jgi:hypothetical protein
MRCLFGQQVASLKIKNFLGQYSRFIQVAWMRIGHERNALMIVLVIYYGIIVSTVIRSDLFEP